jgi:nitrite reductase/ring-hydroxylating ferredoxin subunit/uncharacterized membrane protein
MMETLHSIVNLIDRQIWLDKLSKRMQKLVQTFFSSGGTGMIRFRDFLHGVWLGHPLHPVLTDVPIGAWVAALVLDIMEMSTGRKGFAKGADTAVKVGLIGATGAAVTGIADWHHTEHRPRRIGSMHAILNTTATILYVISLMTRSKGNRKAGWGFALGGFAFSTAAAYLGGHLVYGLKIGVDRSPDLGLPEEFTAVLPDTELPVEQLKRVHANQVPILLFRRNDQIYALAETCAHMGGPLAEGEVINTQDGAPARVVCPWHGSQFSLADGRVLKGPSTYIQPCFETRVRGGLIEVRAVKDTVD